MSARLEKPTAYVPIDLKEVPRPEDSGHPRSTGVWAGGREGEKIATSPACARQQIGVTERENITTKTGGSSWERVADNSGHERGSPSTPVDQVHPTV